MSILGDMSSIDETVKRGKSGETCCSVTACHLLSAQTTLSIVDCKSQEEQVLLCSRQSCAVGEQRTTRAEACRRAAGCWLWNMSQSGCTSAAMNTLLPALMATCVVCEAGSRGQKSSEDLASAVSVILRSSGGC